MRSTILALGILALSAVTGAAQEPVHQHPTAPRDTSMAMPGMKQPAAADTARSARGVARDTAMPGMRMGGRDTTTHGMRMGGRDTTMHGMRMGGRGAAGPGHGAMAMPGMSMPMTGPLGIPESRDGSGTAWQPDLTPMFAVHRQAGPWALMFHGNAFLEYIGEGSKRGEQQLGSINWGMGMASRPLAGGDLGLRGMLSLEPITVGKCGYPDLLATGESCNGQALHDRQHPHDMFMELAADYRRPLSRNLAFELYGGPAGEPALGPVAYPHRLSAMWSPLAPISHHWQDATHIAFGVVTGGVYGRRWKLEGSAFNGREPDDNRFNLDLGALDSWSGRLWLVPSNQLALQVSTGYLKDAEVNQAGLHSDVHRTTASLTWQRPRAAMGSWATTLVWGQNRAHGQTTNATLLEGSLDLDGRNVFFGRGELAQKSGEDLALGDPTLDERIFRVAKLTLGYSRQLGAGTLQPAVGGQLALNFMPSALEPFYHATAAPGFAVFFNLHPAPMGMTRTAAASRTGLRWTGLEVPLPPPSPADSAAP